MIGITHRIFLDWLNFLWNSLSLYSYWKMKLQKRRLLNSYESILFAYLLMLFSLISSKYKYLECLNCDLNYKLVVSILYSIVFFSYLILTLNAFINKQRNQIRFFRLLFLPLVIYFPISIYYLYSFIKATLFMLF